MRVNYSTSFPEELCIFGTLFKEDETNPFDAFEQISLWDILNITEETKEKEEKENFFGCKKSPADLMPKIKDVYYNKPATIVWWDDGTKTVVKCQYKNGDRYDKEKGLAMAIIKKLYGNNGSFNEIFRKWGCWEETKD